MPIPTEYVRVVELLTRSTRTGSLRWRPSILAGEYVAKLPDYSVAVSINPYVETIGSEDGRISAVYLQVLLPEGIQVALFDVQPGEPDFSRVRSLYEMAAGRAMSKSQMAEQLATQLGAMAG